MKILVVDDEKSARTLLGEMLKEAGYSFLEAEDGRQALETVNKENVDLILLDRTMPVMDGLTFLQTLRDRGREIPVIMISAYGEEKLWGQALDLGAKDYLLKPFKAEDVLAVIRRHKPHTKGHK